MLTDRRTDKSEYTETLRRKQQAWWKRLLDVQAPYRWNLQRLRSGYTLDIGCGIGRNLIHLKGAGVGIDHNRQSVEICRSRGLIAWLPEEFRGSPYDSPDLYDSLLLAHVAEHMTQQEAVNLISTYLRDLKPGGRLMLITPQEAGFRSDPTHVQFMDFAQLRSIHHDLGLSITEEYSFPFPRFAGRVFTYNEFVSVSCKPT